jgi:hypothetical protein
MSYLLDTNVVSELSRREPSPRVKTWFKSVPNSALHLSVLSVGEIRKGVELVADAKRKERLRLWLENDLPAWFEDRLLPVDADICDRWGRLLAAARRPLPAIDSLLAATALHHGLRIVTRNTSDFQFDDIETINPWES